jgi:hypothetical protein
MAAHVPNHVRVLVALVACFWLQPSWPAGVEANWPPFLPRSGEIRTDEAVQKFWRRKTFARKLSAVPLNVPMDLYTALIDVPDVVAAAANHLGIAFDTVQVMGDAAYELRSPDGSRASIQVLVRQTGERVTFSQGQLNTGGLVIRGAVLGVLKLYSEADGIHQDLMAYVLIDSAIVAWLSKAFLPLMSRTVDEELSRGFKITGAVAKWAWQNRDEFCHWQETARLEFERVQRVAYSVGCS